MLTKLKAFLNGETTAAPKHDALQLAVAALLVEAAWRDDVFEPAERAAIERVLAERFEIAPEEAAALIKTAGEKRSNQLFGFTNKIVKAMDEADRIKIIEMLWEVAYADGMLDPDEDALIRRVAGLVFVSDQDRGAARRRVRERLGLL
jgi:uncharacterized tellurite resistance protein B-like protein